jgi:hypothetical protein
MSCHGPPNPFRDAGVGSDSLTGMHMQWLIASSLLTGAAYARVCMCPPR